MGLRGKLAGLIGVIAIAGAVTAAPAPAEPTLPPPDGGEFVLGPEGNHLWAYDTGTNEHQLVIEAVNGSSDPVEAAPPGSDRRDINGQICVSPDQQFMVSGEDTVIAGEGGDGGSSHDPRIAGWGFFRLAGDTLGEITARQVGKLAPEAGRGPGYTGDPDNYGCGFLDQRRLFTSALGNTLPGEPANGQLFLWFGKFTNGFHQETDPETGTSFFVGAVDHCVIDDTLATAGGIAIDDNGDVYVAANRPDDQGAPGGIWRYRGRWPRTFAECTPEFVDANILKELVVPAAPAPVDIHSPTPSAVVISPDDTLVVSSVFSGTVSEYTKGGRWVRDIYPLSPVTAPTGPTTQTPFGLAFTGGGLLWIADLGIAVAQPAPGQGSLVQVEFHNSTATPLGRTVRSGLTFPDGLGVYAPLG